MGFVNKEYQSSRNLTGGQLITDKWREWPLITQRNNQLGIWPLTGVYYTRWCGITEAQTESNSTIPGMKIAMSIVLQIIDDNSRA